MSEPKHAAYVASCRSCGVLHEPCSLNTAVTRIEAHKLVHKHPKSQTLLLNHTTQSSQLTLS